MSKEAMKLALEALKELVAQTEGRYFCMKHDHVALQNARFAIARLREALANEALDKKAENARELGLDYEPAQYSDIVSDGGLDPRNNPPAQRTWVGLTRMDLIKCGVLPFGMSYELCQAIEAKLKEKNSAM